MEGFVFFLIFWFVINWFSCFSWFGFVIGFFVFGYGIVCIIVEFFCEFDVYIGYLIGGIIMMGMVLLLFMVLIGVVLIWCMFDSVLKWLKELFGVEVIK